MKKPIVVVAIVMIFYLIYSIPDYFPSRENVFVERVIDGDTIETSVGNVRLLGINAPEKNEPYYSEATERLRELVEGKRVELEKDSRNKDAYRRFLRYVYVEEEFVNVIMIEEGLAFRFGNITKHEKEFLDAEGYARENKRGVWS